MTDAIAKAGRKRRAAGRRQRVVMGMGWSNGLVCGKFHANLKAAACNDADNDINFPTRAGADQG
jgi:hypothetical protein